MSVQIISGNALEQLRRLPTESVHCCVTSPPYYGLRDYGMAGQIGLEPSPDEYVAALVAVFREVRRVLRKDGTLWVVIGDSYVSSPPGNKSTAGSGLNGAQTSARYAERLMTKDNRNKRPIPLGLKSKDLIGIPWLLAFALRNDGWYLRQDIIWSKPNPMPESVTDRCTKAHEYLFLMSRSERYYYDAAAIAEPPSVNTHSRRSDGETSPKLRDNGDRRDGASATLAIDFVSRNRRSVWTVSTEPFPEAHFATFPPALIEPCIKAGCPEGGTVLDPFSGAGTTGLVADRLGRNAILIELNPAYAEMAERRIYRDGPLFADVAITQQEMPYAAE